MNNLKKSFAALLVLGGFSLVMPVQVVQAADLSLFQPGRISDDAIFTDGNSMSPDQIQTFLNQKNSTCLKNFRSLSLRDSNGDGVVQDSTTEKYGGTSGTETMSAAELISSAAKIYRISPKALLATLEKEQGLVSTTDCANWKYNTALGYGCPDTAPCDESAFGFTRQIDYGTYHFRGFIDDSLDSVPYTTGEQPIFWHPDTGRCGSSIVNISNRTTVALYSYTPYRPNQASLNAGYGTGDSCSSYGNRNFYNFFVDWFGSTLADPFAAQYISQSSYPSLFPQETKKVWFQYRNVGNNFWKDDLTTFPGAPPIRIATSNPINRESPLRSPNWTSQNRPTGVLSRVYESNGSTLSADQHTVHPGQIGRYEFAITAPSSLKPGTYREFFQPIAEGSAHWNMGGLVFQDVTVQPLMKATYVSQSAYQSIKKGDTKTMHFRFRNDGNVTWKDDVSKVQGENSIRLATSAPINRITPFYDSTWPSHNRTNGTFTTVYESDGTTLAANQHETRPGQIAKFEFKITAGTNASPGTYREFFQPIVEGSSSWDMGGVVFQDITIADTTLSAAYQRQSPYPEIKQGESQTIFFDYKNTGTASWKDDQSKTGFISPIRLATSQPINRTSKFTSNTWIANNRPTGTLAKVFEADGATLTGDQHTVYPGQIGRYEFTLQVPQGLAAGTYQEYFQPVAEGATKWDLGGVVWIKVNVIQ